jgi:predicted Zn-dependent protease
MKLTRPKSLVILTLVVGFATSLYFILPARHSEDRLAEANRAIERRDFARASQMLEAHLEKTPNDLDALLIASRTARRQGAHHKSIEYLRRYKELGGDAAVLSQENRLRQVQGGDLRDVDLLLRECADAPDSPDNFFVLEAVLRGCFLEAELKKRGDELDPTGPEVQYGIRAADEFLKLTMGPLDRAEGLFWSGSIRDWAGMHARGVEDLRKSIELAPEHFDARFALAKSIGQEAPAETTEHLEILASARPEDEDVRYYLAAARRWIGHTDEAASLLDELLARHPDRVQYLLARANVDLDQGHIRAAESRLRAALALAPRHPELNLAMSRCLHLLGKPEEAGEFFARFERAEKDRKKGNSKLTPQPRPEAPATTTHSSDKPQ